VSEAVSTQIPWIKACFEWPANLIHRMQMVFSNHSHAETSGTISINVEKSFWVVVIFIMALLVIFARIYPLFCLQLSHFSFQYTTGFLWSCDPILVGSFLLQ
jgi:hypothetical protein